MFKDGLLAVPKENQTLQKLLSLYHPDLKGRYAELKPEEVAKDDLDRFRSRNNGFERC